MPARSRNQHSSPSPQHAVSNDWLQHAGSDQDAASDDWPQHAISDDWAHRQPEYSPSTPSPAPDPFFDGQHTQMENLLDEGYWEHKTRASQTPWTVIPRW